MESRMDKNRKNRIVNWIMAVSLIVVMTTGMLLRALPGMWLGIAHGGSGIILTISIVAHCLGHRGKGR